MKTITLQGTEEQIADLESKLFPRHDKLYCETRVYVVDSEEHNTKHLTDDMFMTLAEGYGRVYTLPTFQEAFNYGDVNTFTDVVRFISVPLFL
jgi:hypothetical protein